MEVLLLYFLIINYVAFTLAGYDKYSATKNKRRIPENTLFSMALLGGSVGLLSAMLLFRHKTSKRSFIAKSGLIFLVQIIVLFLKLNDNF